MADLRTLINTMQADGSFLTVTSNPLAQFGTAARRYVGAEILPLRFVPENAFREANVKYRTVIANSGTRYSPAQKKGGVGLVGDVLVELGNIDIARELTAVELDALQHLLRSGLDAEAADKLLGWYDMSVVRAIMETIEQQRWQAIVDGSVVRTGANGYNETIAYSNPSGHRAAAGGSWSSDAYDPFDDILAMNNLLSSKGYRLTRIITSTPVITKMAGNEKVARRTGALSISASGTIELLSGFATRDAINNVMTSNGLPALEVYDLTYRTEDGTANRFLDDGAMVFVAETGQDEPIVFNNATKILPNIVGYSAVGRPVGYGQPGFGTHIEFKTDKPPRIEAEAWTETLPVITEPESIAVITGIA
jgi:hypothetical protein